MRGDWTAFGGCISGSTALPRGATRTASGGAATTNTTAKANPKAHQKTAALERAEEELSIQRGSLAALIADSLYQRAFSAVAVELAVEDLFPSSFAKAPARQAGPRSSLPLVMATTTSRPMIWRLRRASALCLLAKAFGVRRCQGASRNS